MQDNYFDWDDLNSYDENIWRRSDRAEFLIEGVEFKPTIMTVRSVDGGDTMIVDDSNYLEFTSTDDDGFNHHDRRHWDYMVANA